MTEGWKHKKAKEIIMFELSLYFNVVEEEFFMPVPNSERVMGDLKARSTKSYSLDIYAEDPIWRKIEKLEYQRIGIEIDGAVNHMKTKAQFRRDRARSKYLCEYEVYEGLLIVRFDSDYVVGKSFRDPRKSFLPRPKLTPHEILEEVRVTPRKIFA